MEAAEADLFRVFKGRPLFRLVTEVSLVAFSADLAVAVMTLCSSGLLSPSSLLLSLSLLLVSSLDSSELFFSSMFPPDAPFTDGLEAGVEDEASSSDVKDEAGGVAPGRRGLIITRFVWGTG